MIERSATRITSYITRSNNGGRLKKRAYSSSKSEYPPPSHDPVNISAMATQRNVDAQSSPMMNLYRLQTEVSNGTDKFTRQLTILNCVTQDKYMVYASCQQFKKGVHLEGG